MTIEGMIATQQEKAVRFQELHRRPGLFLIPNPWDAGSTRILAALGFEAFTTLSAAWRAWWAARSKMRGRTG